MCLTLGIILVNIYPLRCSKCEKKQSFMSPLLGADLRSSSRHPDTSLHRETTDMGLVHPVVRLYTSQPVPNYTAW